MSEWLSSTRAKLNLPLDGLSWSLEIEEHIKGGLYMARFEEFEQIGNVKRRTICTEQMLGREHLEEIREDINFILGESS